IGAKNDSMDPEHMKWMSNEVQNGSFLYCPNGSHCALYDDQEIYMAGLTKFILEVNKGQKKIKL
ncbi:MAG: proline iminopeptidase, partial [Flavobacterium sp.]|nr:proline iminopeptidase [Flavobacterium sp.]